MTKATDANKLIVTNEVVSFVQNGNLEVSLFFEVSWSCMNFDSRKQKLTCTI